MIENIIHELPLPHLTREGDNYHFRCIVCGDSQKSETKKRGWLLVNGPKIRYHCFNCGYSKPVLEFLKDHFPEVRKRYVKTLFKSKRQKKKDRLVMAAPARETEEDAGALKSRFDLPKLYSLPDDHMAVAYFKKRLIPDKFLKYLYYTDNYFEFVNTVIPGKFEEDKIPATDPRIVIPFYNAHRKIFAMQGRALLDGRIRYVTIKIDDHKKIFGLERLNPAKPILVFEGAFDSFFMPNAIACGGADLDFKYLQTLAAKDRYIFCYDNEPRNKEMCDRIGKVLRAGFKVCLMPGKYKRYGKDINKMVENGLTPREICAIIRENVYQGKMGMVNFKLWKRGK